MKAFLKVTIFSIAFICLSHMGMAQPCPPGSSSPTPPCNGDPDPAIPLDGGVSLLIAAGLGIGGKKLYDEHKKKNI